jgi:hypothetical protein
MESRPHFGLQSLQWGANDNGNASDTPTNLAPRAGQTVNVALPATRSATEPSSVRATAGRLRRDRRAVLGQPPRASPLGHRSVSVCPRGSLGGARKELARSQASVRDHPPARGATAGNPSRVQDWRDDDGHDGSPFVRSLCGLGERPGRGLRAVEADDQSAPSRRACQARHQLPPLGERPARPATAP